MDSDETDDEETSGPVGTQPIRAVPSSFGGGRRLGDAGGHEGHGHADDDSDDDETKQDFFAGGEKSGLAVQNPDDLKKKILEKAKR